MDDFHKQQDLMDFSEEEVLDSQPRPGIGIKRFYVSPVLKHQAHLRDITLAPTTGVHESGLGDCREANAVNDDEKSSNSGGGGIFENDIFGG